MRAGTLQRPRLVPVLHIQQVHLPCRLVLHMLPLRGHMLPQQRRDFLAQICPGPLPTQVNFVAPRFRCEVPPHVCVPVAFMRAFAAICFAADLALLGEIDDAGDKPA